MVKFLFEEVNIPLKNRKKLKAFIADLIKNEGLIPLFINYIFCTDVFLLKLNQEYLNHDTYTDILTFNLSENEEKLSAEIYISAERVRDNAAKFHTSLEEELHRVIFHGLLHLLGYNDHSRKEKNEMSAKENELLHRYFKEQ